MNRQGIAMGRVVITLALVLGLIVTALAGQLWLAIPFAIFAAVVGAAALFSRAKTQWTSLPGMPRIQLRYLAHARSGDKGDTANVGVIALRPEFYPHLLRELTPERVKAHFRGIVHGPVERYELPNLEAINFLLHSALGGGGTVSLKTDAQGKVLSTAMLRMEVEVPEEVARLAEAGPA